MLSGVVRSVGRDRPGDSQSSHLVSNMVRRVFEKVNRIITDIVLRLPVSDSDMMAVGSRGPVGSGFGGWSGQL